MSSSNSRPRNKQPGKSQLRIIGGQWRSRKLTFTPAPGLRPTTDRIRETVFNWLAPYIQDARCADIFAGSGALGLEALSRGATHCDFVDTSMEGIKQITEHLKTLRAATRGSCHNLPASEYLRQVARPFDIVFIDPPFGCGLIEPSCNQIAVSQALASMAIVYIESPAKEALTYIPADWELFREKIAGEVAYRLYRSKPF